MTASERKRTGIDKVGSHTKQDPLKKKPPNKFMPGRHGCSATSAKPVSEPFLGTKRRGRGASLVLVETTPCHFRVSEKKC